MEKTKIKMIKSLINFKKINIVLYIIIFALGITYIAGTNDLAIKGFVLSDLKKQQNEISEENKNLELKVMALSSYNTISEKIKNLKMVSAGSIDYIYSGNEIMAKK